MPRRNFNQKFDRNLSNLLNRLPQGNVGYAIVGLNTLFYFLYCIWPPHNAFGFMNNFTFSMYGIHRGYLHNMLTCHFTHMSFFSYLIDSVILFMFCQNLSMMFGNVFVAKTVILSMLLGSMFMFVHQSTQNINKSYHGNDAILRGLIFSLIFQNPSAQLMLFPIPVNIPAWAIAALLLTLDFLSFNTAAFGGVSASYIMVNHFL